MRSNECLQMVRDELDRVGVQYTVDTGKHIHVRWRHGDADRLVVVSVSPSGNRARWNARSDVRKLLKRDGLIGR